MNNFAYVTQDAEKVSSKIEELVRKDLGSSSPLIYSISQEGQTGVSASSLLTDIGRGLFGGKTKTLFDMGFELNQPRKADININVCRQGIGCYVGTIGFFTKLNKPVNSTVALEDPKMFGSSKFAGDENASAKLNGNKDLLKLAAKLSRVKSDVGQTKMDRYFKIEPSEGGSNLIVITLPRATSMGMSATTDAADFFEIADMIEKALS
jgi:hypothetical protein